jgi:ABC-type sugar transport system substrate-binding protein
MSKEAKKVGAETGQPAAPKRGGGARLLVTLMLAAVFGLAFGLVACGDDDSGSSGSDSSDSGGTASKSDIESFEPPTNVLSGAEADSVPVDKANGDCKLQMLVAYNIEFFKNVAYGADTEAKRLGCDIDIQAAQGYGDTTNQLQQFDSALAKQPSAIILHAADEKAIAPSVNRAWEQGVPVVYASVKGPSEKVLAVLTNDELAGEQQGKYIGEQDPKAKVVAMCGPPGIEWAKIRCEGFKKGLAEAAPDAQVVAEKFHPMDRGEVSKVVDSTLEGQPDANWIYNSTDLQATGTVDALRNRGAKPGEIKVTTLTIGRETEKLMRQGWIQYAVTERPVMFGKLAVDMAVTVLNGGEVPAGIVEPAQPAFAGKQGAAKFCGVSCDDLMQGEVEWNWSPEDYNF